QKGYSVINAFGLADGMACCLLILLYVQDELAYDRFHERAGRIYRVTSDLHVGAQEASLASSMNPLGPVLERTFPEVERAVRVGQFKDQTLVRRGDRVFYEDDFYFADPQVFDVFTFPLVSGDPATALAAPGSVVIDEDMARKYFGAEDPLGQ